MSTTAAAVAAGSNNNSEGSSKMKQFILAGGKGALGALGGAIRGGSAVAAQIKTADPNAVVGSSNTSGVMAEPEMPEITGAMIGGTMRNNPNVIEPNSTNNLQDIPGMSAYDLRQKYAELITSGTAGSGSNRNLLKAYASRIKELSSGPNGGGAFGAFTGFNAATKDPHSFLENQDQYSVEENVNSMNDSIEMMETGGFSPTAKSTATGVFGSQDQRDLAVGASTSQKMLASLSRTQS